MIDRNMEKKTNRKKIPMSKAELQNLSRKTKEAGEKSKRQGFIDAMLYR